MIWKTRAVLATTASLALVGAGAAAMASTEAPPGSGAAPAAAPEGDPQAAQLAQSLAELQGQIDGLERSVAAGDLGTTQPGSDAATPRRTSQPSPAASASGQGPAVVGPDDSHVEIGEGEPASGYGDEGYREDDRGGDDD